MSSSNPVARRAATVAAALTFALAIAGASPAGAAGAGAPEARADSAQGTLVYIKDHDLWIARGDGSGQRRITSNGTAHRPYVSPSQSRSGVIAVGLGDEILRLRQDGTVLNRINPPPLTSSTSHPLDGPVQDVEISPGGSLIAYTLASYQCPVGTPCMARTASSVTRADRFTRNHGQTYYRQSSWVGDGRLLQSGGYLHQVMLVDLGREPVHWFDDHQLARESTDLGDVALAPNGRHLIAVRGYGEGTHLAWYAVNGNAQSGGRPPLPDWLCVTSDDPLHSSPTWSPDSTTMAWAATSGIWVKTDPGPDRCGTPQPRLLIRGGSQPHWSAAALTAPAPSTKQLTNKRKPAITGRPRVGRTLRADPGAWSMKPTKVRYQWLRGGRPVKGATTRTHRLRRADAGARIAVRVTVRAGTKSAVATSRPTKKVRR